MKSSNGCPFMPISEMRKHEWTINWSAGKDSMATVIACIKYDIPIKEINYVRMMYDDNIPAILPEMVEFVDETIDFFRDVYGIKVNVIKSRTCKEMICDKIYFKSKYPELNGTRYTLVGLGRGMCLFNRYKIRALDSIRDSEYEMIGYAIDEPLRYKNLKHPNQESILCTLGITEKKAYDICKRNNLLSPLYKLGLYRDGCWFCPSIRPRGIAYIYREHPELVDIIVSEIKARNKDHLHPRNNQWVEWYLEYR